MSPDTDSPAGHVSPAELRDIERQHQQHRDAVTTWYQRHRGQEDSHRQCPGATQCLMDPGGGFVYAADGITCQGAQQLDPELSICADKARAMLAHWDTYLSNTKATGKVDVMVKHPSVLTNMKTGEPHQWEIGEHFPLAKEMASLLDRGDNGTVYMPLV